MKTKNVILTIPTDEEIQSLMGEMGFQAKVDFMIGKAESMYPGWTYQGPRRWVNANVVEDGKYRVELQAPAHWSEE